MNKEQKQIIDHLSLTNDPKYNLAKAAEELSELSLVLQQKALKPTKVDDQEIIDEIGDVKIRLKILETMYDKELINKRVTLKLSQYQGYIENNKYKGGI